MPTPYASLGYVGYVRFHSFEDGTAAFNVRATSADMKLSQAIEKGDLVDSKYDKTTVILRPREVGGSIAFPAVHEDGSASTAALWRKAIERDAQGRLKQFKTRIKYADSNALFDFTGCIVDSFEMSVTQGDTFNITANLIGIDRETVTVADAINYNNRNTRIVTWNDVTVELGGGSFGTITGAYIRSFTGTVNNNSQRYYTLNGKLVPQDVAPTKRDIDGTVVLMGRHPQLAELARTNENYYTFNNWVKCAYKVGGAGNYAWGVQIPGTVFEIEEMSLTNDLLETTVNWHALPGATYNNIAETFVI